VQRLDSLTDVYAASGYNGVIRVAKEGRLVYEKPYGYANLEKKIPHRSSTLFKTESVGKMFTAVSILQLVEKGKLGLNQTVKEILPELKLEKADQITVHHLLNHTSGLQSPWDHPNYKFKTAYSRQQLEKIVAEVPRAFDSVGKEMYYSNSGYVLLSWMIEKVSGLPFDEYFQQHIFSAAGMKNTRHLGDTLMPEANGAQPYRILSSKKYIRMSETLGAKAGGAGGWISTAEDLQLFLSALNRGSFIKPQTLLQMQTANGTAPKEKGRRFYAYGLEVYPEALVPGADIFGHNGGGAGFSIDAFTDARSGYVVTSCTNQYQNSRPIMENYFRVVLNQPLKKVTVPAMVRFYDEVEAKGLDAVITDTSVFHRLSINRSTGFLMQMGDAFLAAKDYKSWEKWMKWTQTVVAAEPMVHLVYADGLLELGRKEEARKHYEAGQELARKNKDERALQYVETKLKSL
jgi:CubicO group peptidase (beta-lactamase class C family)